MTAILSPKQFWLLAASWGSAVTSGDPGACMYGFTERGLVQSEEHRRDCIAYIEHDCRRAAEVNAEAGVDGAEVHPDELEAMLNYLRNAPVEGSLPEMDDFTSAYVLAALWSTCDESDEAGGEPLDQNYGPEHISPETLQRMIADCARFQELYGHLLTEENYIGGGEGGVEELGGHDFWLNRNGHGVGFWDGDWASPADDTLSDAAKSFGEYDLYVGDDGRIHGSGGVPEPARICGGAGIGLDM